MLKENRGVVVGEVRTGEEERDYEGREGIQRQRQMFRSRRGGEFETRSCAPWKKGECGGCRRGRRGKGKGKERESKEIEVNRTEQRNKSQGSRCGCYRGENLSDKGAREKKAW